MDFEFGKIVITDTVTNTRILQDELAEYGSLHLVYTGADDRFQIIMPSELQFNFLVSDGSDAKYFHLLTAYEQRYKVELMVYDETETYLSTLWQGYLLPEQFNEPYQSGKFFINFNATDGLGLLKGKGYNILNQFGKTSITSLLSNILSATGLQLPFYISPAIENATATVLVSQIEVDTNSYKDEAKDKGGILMDYYDLLENILTVLGCKIFQYNGAWYLVGINTLTEPTINFEHYNYLGVFQDHVEYTRTEKPIYFRDKANVNVQFPFNSVIVEWDHKEPENILPEDLAFQGVPVSSPWSEVLGYPAKYWQSHFTDYSGYGLQVFLNDKDGVYFAPPEDGVWRVQAGYVSFDTDVPTADIDSNYMSLAEPIFISPPQEVSFNCTGTLRFANSSTASVDFTGAVLYEILLNDVVILSNKSAFPNNTNYDFEYQADGYNVAFSLEIEILTLKENGYLDIRFYAFDNTIHTGFSYTVFHTIELIKRQEFSQLTIVSGESQSSLKKEIATYYGSSLNDLSKRKLFVSEDVPYPSTEITYPAFQQQVPVLIYKEESLLPGLEWHLALINASDFVLMNEYKEHIQIKRSGLFFIPDNYSVLNGDPTSSEPGFTGYYFGQLVDPSTEIAFVETDEVWINKPITTETTEIRNYLDEKWKPVNDTVGTSAMEALAKVYKTSIPDIIFRLSGTALGLYSPLDLINFNYIESKYFIPTSLDLDFTNSETTLVVCEARNEGEVPTPPTYVFGCMDPLANNYNPLANVSDGSCTYTSSIAAPTNLVLTEGEITVTYLQALIISTSSADTSSGAISLMADVTRYTSGGTDPVIGDFIYTDQFGIYPLNGRGKWFLTESLYVIQIAVDGEITGSIGI